MYNPKAADMWSAGMTVLFLETGRTVLDNAAYAGTGEYDRETFALMDGKVRFHPVPVLPRVCEH